MKTQLAVLAAVLLMGSGAAFGATLHTIQSGNLSCVVMDPNDANRYNLGIRFSNVAQVLSAKYNGLEFLQCDRAITSTDPNPNGTGGDGGLAMEFDLGESMPAGPPGNGAPMNNPPGYSAASVGQPFIMVGVGVLTKDISGTQYNWQHVYPIVRRATTTATWGADRVNFVQDSGAAANGYGYRLEEDVIVSGNVLTMNYKLKNTGTNSFQTDQFNHNFFKFSNDPTGTNYEIEFPYPLTTVQYLPTGLTTMYVSGNKLMFNQKLFTGWGKPFIYPPADPHGNYVIVRNMTIGQTLVAQLSLDQTYTAVYALDKYVCPEQNTPIYLDPNQEALFSRTYVFYTPEPATVLLVGLGGAIAFVRRRMRRT